MVGLAGVFMHGVLMMCCVLDGAEGKKLRGWGGGLGGVSVSAGRRSHFP